MSGTNPDYKRICADAFHAHLDKCPQCANNPFALCPVGNLLLRKAVTGK